MNEIADIDYPSPLMKTVLAECRRVATSPVTVLLLGESGTGKGFLARYIHRHSPRCYGPFFKMNCAAISKGLAESELFGHEQGAFTGAVGTKKGYLELAAGGTLLLDELGDMDMDLQSKFLSFLDDKQFLRVGGQRMITGNVRLIAATNKDLEQLCQQGLFRRDLHYRLNVFPIWVPPLRERKEDIPALVRTLLSRLSFEMKLGYTPTVDSPALQILASYDWPGNVRELRNILERPLVLTHGNSVIGEKAIISAINRDGNGTDRSGRGHRIGDVHRVIDPPKNATRVEISDELLKQMIEEVFDGAPTPVAVLMEVLGWTRKETSAAVNRVGCRPGKPGRLPARTKEDMIRAARFWLSQRGFL